MYIKSFIFNTLFSLIFVYLLETKLREINDF